MDTLGKGVFALSVLAVPVSCSGKSDKCKTAALKNNNLMILLHVKKRSLNCLSDWKDKHKLTGIKNSKLNSLNTVLWFFLNLSKYIYSCAVVVLLELYHLFKTLTFILKRYLIFLTIAAKCNQQSFKPTTIFLHVHLHS